MGKLTPFGREVRRLRLEHPATPMLKDLADAVGVSSAFLSAVETGRKPPPAKIVDDIARFFDVDVRKRAELHRLAAASAKSIQLSLTGTTDRSRELAVAFARRFPDLTEENVERMLELIEHEQSQP